jgi:hypothetical protein
MRRIEQVSDESFRDPNRLLALSYLGLFLREYVIL